jgi:hypothetical protein
MQRCEHPEDLGYLLGVIERQQYTSGADPHPLRALEDGRDQDLR